VRLSRIIPGPKGCELGKFECEKCGHVISVTVASDPNSDPETNTCAVLDRAEKYRLLATKSWDRGEREGYERIVELYVQIAEEMEALP
jgi:hypothetical protein